MATKMEKVTQKWPKIHVISVSRILNCDYFGADKHNTVYLSPRLVGKDWEYPKTVHKLFWGNRLGITVAVLAVPRII